MVLGACGARILVEDDFAVEGSREAARGEARDAVAIRRSEGVEDIIEAVAREVRIELDVHQALLAVGRADVREGEERRREGSRRPGRHDLDGPAELPDQHAPVGQEGEVRRQIEARSEDDFIAEGRGSRRGVRYRRRQVGLDLGD